MPIDYLPGALDDIARLRVYDPRALAVALAVLQEAGGDRNLIEKLTTTQGDVHFGRWRCSVKAWQVARRGQDNLLRMRVFDSPATGYRIVYGFDWQTRRIGVLGILHKSEFDYGLSSEISERILRDWRDATAGRPT